MARKETGDQLESILDLVVKTSLEMERATTITSCFTPFKLPVRKNRVSETICEAHDWPIHNM